MPYIVGMDKHEAFGRDLERVYVLALRRAEVEMSIGDAERKAWSAVAKAVDVVQQGELRNLSGADTQPAPGREVAGRISCQAVVNVDLNDLLKSEAGSAQETCGKKIFNLLFEPSFQAVK